MNARTSELMNKYKQRGVAATLLIIWLVVAAGPVCADPANRQVSYSPDYWPSRWSSAIRHQQTAGFPTRVEEKAPLEELPETVLEQDLFFSPSVNSRFDQGNRAYGYGQPGYGQPGYGQRALRHRFSRSNGTQARDAAYAYQPGFSTTPVNQPRANYGRTYGYPMAMPGPAMGLLPGYPGTGLPMMPGGSGAYPMNVGPMNAYPLNAYPMSMGPMSMGPMGIMPFGYPGNMAMRNPPFGYW